MKELHDNMANFITHCENSKIKSLEEIWYEWYVLSQMREKNLDSISLYILSIFQNNDRLMIDKRYKVTSSWYDSLTCIDTGKWETHAFSTMSFYYWLRRKHEEQKTINNTT